VHIVADGLAVGRARRVAADQRFVSAASMAALGSLVRSAARKAAHSNGSDPAAGLPVGI
jgi:hypothetical protein